MANKKKPPRPNPAEPSEPSQPGQQMQDDGSQAAETFANIEPDSGQGFANITPVDQ